MNGERVGELAVTIFLFTVARHCYTVGDMVLAGLFGACGAFGLVLMLLPSPQGPRRGGSE